MSRPSSSQKIFPEYIRAVVRAVMQSFRYETDTYTVQEKAHGAHHLVFHVPKTETITYGNMIAVREACRRARVCVQWNKDHLLFVVKVPQPPLRRQAAQPSDHKRPRAERSSGLEGYSHKKQRGESGDGKRGEPVPRG